MYLDDVGGAGNRAAATEPATTASRGGLSLDKIMARLNGVQQQMAGMSAEEKTNPRLLASLNASVMQLESAVRNAQARAQHHEQPAPQQLAQLGRAGGSSRRLKSCLERGSKGAKRKAPDTLPTATGVGRPKARKQSFHEQVESRAAAEARKLQQKQQREQRKAAGQKKASERTFATQPLPAAGPLQASQVHNIAASMPMLQPTQSRSSVAPASTLQLCNATAAAAASQALGQWNLMAAAAAPQATQLWAPLATAAALQASQVCDPMAAAMALPASQLRNPLGVMPASATINPSPAAAPLQASQLEPAALAAVLLASGGLGCLGSGVQQQPSTAASGQHGGRPPQ